MVFWFMVVDTPYGTETDSVGARDFFAGDYANKYMTIGIGTVLILISVAIFMFVSSNNAKYEKNNKVATGTSVIGTILAFVGPGVYYGYLEREFPGFWSYLFNPGIGFFLPIIAGILGIIATSFNIYAITLESKVGEERVTEKYQPPPDTQIDFQVQQEGPKFCPNCGAKLTGPFCQECGTKAYLLV